MLLLSPLMSMSPFKFSNANEPDETLHRADCKEECYEKKQP